MSQSPTTSNQEAASDATSSIALHLTQTEQYEQEPFEQFKPKVERLCRQLWPEAHSVELERIPGGVGNRIVAATVSGRPRLQFLGPRLKRICAKLVKLIGPKDKRPEGKTSSPLPYGSFILRIPREPEEPDESTIPYDTAAVAYAAGRFNFPVPKIVKVELGVDNPIASPFVIQTRIEGVPLDELWHELSHQQRLSVAKLVGKILTEFTWNPSPAPGTVDPGDEQCRKLLALNPTVHPQPTNTSESAEAVQIPALIRDRLHSWMYNHAQGRPYYPYAALADLVREDNLGPNPNYLFRHGDFYPRNIMAKVVDEETVKITGIIDWDAAEWAPSFVAIEAPCWLWKWDDYASGDLEDDKLRIDAAIEPDKVEDKELKLAFEGAVPEEYLQVAYLKDVEVLRWVWFIAKEGLRTGTHWQMAREAIEDMTGQPFESD